MTPPGRLVLTGCAIATVDGAGSEHAEGHVVVEGERIVAVGAGSARAAPGDRVVDVQGCLATPGLVNCHDHLYQWGTRGLAQQEDLFGWLRALYPLWAGIDAEGEHALAAAALATLALSGCTTSTDHHYVFPATGGDVLGAEIAAAGEVGLRFHPCRGSMDLGRSRGGLPPDEVCEDTDDILAATRAAVDRFHDPGPGAMVQIAIAPCSPFSVTERLLVESAALARRHGLRLHTHLAETLEEESFCVERFGCRPAEYLDRLGWLGPDVWLAHCVHVDAGEIERLATTGSAVAHCPSSNARLGAGIAPVPELLAAGVTVGIGVDGASSNEAGMLGAELHQALYAARARRGPKALSARAALELGTIGGARCLGRDRDLGSLEAGKLADIALWRIDGVAHAGIADPVASLVLGAPAPLRLLLVAGRTVVEDGELVTAPAVALARAAAAASARLQHGYGTVAG